MERVVNLFVYGTLMSEEYLYSLTGRRFRRREAELPGMNESFPTPVILISSLTLGRG